MHPLTTVRFAARLPDLDVLQENEDERKAAEALKHMFEQPLARAVVKGTSDKVEIKLSRSLAMKPGLSLDEEIRNNPSNWEPAVSLSLFQDNKKLNRGGKLFRLSELRQVIQYLTHYFTDEDYADMQAFQAKHDELGALRQNYRRLLKVFESFWVDAASADPDASASVIHPEDIEYRRAPK
jgi:hypothetical protein